MGLKRLVLGGVAVAVAAGGAVALPARAGSVCTASSCVVWADNVVGTGSAGPIAPINLNQQLVHFECTAVSYIAEGSTTLEKCSLYANGVFVTGMPTAVTLPGNVSAFAADAATSIGANLTVCWDVKAQPVFGAGIDPPGNCSTIHLPVTAGAA